MVAEEGTYTELAANPDGAFSKLMEWQLSGQEPPPRHDPQPTEVEEIEKELEHEDEETESRHRHRS